MTDADSENASFYAKVARVFRYLVDRARQKHELHFAMALMPEMRGMQDAGWSTAEDAQRAFHEYLEFLDSAKGPIRLRVALAFYCHVAEASGFYEVPKNLMRIVGGESHVLWPFKHLVEAHRLTGDRIAPNANKVIKDLAGHAETLGLHELAEVFRDAFDADVRNGYAHADYIVWQDGLRLQRRNGGYPRKITWPEFDHIFNRGINFFHILHQVVSDAIHSYREPKTIRARLQNEPEDFWTIHYKPDGTFGISSGGYVRPATQQAHAADRPQAAGG